MAPPAAVIHSVMERIATIYLLLVGLGLGVQLLSSGTPIYKHSGSSLWQGGSCGTATALQSTNSLDPLHSRVYHAHGRAYMG